MGYFNFLPAIKKSYSSTAGLHYLGLGMWPHQEEDNFGESTWRFKKWMRKNKDQWPIRSSNTREQDCSEMSPTIHPMQF